MLSCGVYRTSADYETLLSINRPNQIPQRQQTSRWDLYTRRSHLVKILDRDGKSLFSSSWKPLRLFSGKIQWLRYTYFDSLISRDSPASLLMFREDDLP